MQTFLEPTQESGRVFFMRRLLFPKVQRCYLFLLALVFSASVQAAELAYDIKPVSYKNLVANLYLPKAAQKLPVVIAFGGAEGGLHTGNAQGELLAPHGVAVLALAYFKEKGLPATLDQIPLDYFIRAVDFVQTVPALDASKIGVLGGSRGAEAAVLLAAFDARITSVLVTTPSSLAWYGRTIPKSAWTYQGQEIPALDIAAGENIPLVKRFEAAMQEPSQVAKARLPFEKINGPIFLISAENDQIWPSFAMSKQIVLDLQARQFRHAVQHFSYPTGHGFSQETAPVIKQQIVEHFVRTLSSPAK